MASMTHALGVVLTGVQKLLDKNLKFVIYSFLNLYLAPHTTINCKAVSTQRPYLTH